MDAIETIEVGDLTVTIYRDPDPTDPRDWHNLGRMLCWHRSYQLGDGSWELIGRNDFDSFTALGRYVTLILRGEFHWLGLIDHSGVSMYVGRAEHPADPGGWDSTPVGLIYVTREDIIREYGDDSPASRASARAQLAAEVEVYDQYLRGDTYGYVIERPADPCECCHQERPADVLDSCWGFLGWDHARREAVATAESYCSSEG